MRRQLLVAALFVTAQILAVSDSPRVEAQDASESTAATPAQDAALKHPIPHHLRAPARQSPSNRQHHLQKRRSRASRLLSLRQCRRLPPTPCQPIPLSPPSARNFPIQLS